jgi:OLD-like protein
MDPSRRRELARHVLEGYVNGPAAATEATVRALAKLKDAQSVVLVEGISDQIALESLAARRGKRLRQEGVVILPIGGASAITRYLTQLGPGGAGLRLAGLCDRGEEDIFRRGLNRARIGSPQTRTDMEDLGFYVCVEDLEDELIRATGTAGVEEIFDTQGDLGSFRSLQRQPEWRGRLLDDQIRRFLGSGAGRKLRYARLLVESIDLNRVPRPLDAVLTAQLGS